MDLLQHLNASELGSGAVVLAWRLLLAAGAGAAVALVARVTLGALRRGLAQTRANRSAQLLLSRLVHFCFLIAGASWVLAIFGVRLTALLALVGVAGLAFSLALQDLLRNLIAGLYILIERPFTLGEHIEFRTFSGVVETIQLRTTALRTLAGQRVVIPNAMLFAEPLVNRSAYGQQLLRLRLSVPLSGPGAATVFEHVASAVAELGGELDRGPATILLESATPEKLTLRAEIWVQDVRRSGPRAALALQERLNRLEVTVLE